MEYTNKVRNGKIYTVGEVFKDVDGFDCCSVIEGSSVVTYFSDTEEYKCKELAEMLAEKLNDKSINRHILTFEEYRIQQAIWLQQEDAKRTNYGTTTEQFIIQCYSRYLVICGVKISNAINTEHELLRIERKKYLNNNEEYEK